MIPDDKDEDDLLDEDVDDDESGDGEDQASLALNTPEPARALQAGKAPKDDAKSPRNRKGKFAKAREGAKSALGESFVITAYQGLGDNTKSTAIQVNIDAAAFGLESKQTEIVAVEPESQEVSAFDRDEITDREMSDEVELLSLLAGMNEKPWENEKLSHVERMMMKQGYERNLESLQKAQDQDLEQNPAKKGDKVKTVAKAAGVAAVVVGAAAARVAMAHDGAQDKDGPSIAGVSRGPRREADQDHAQIKNEAQKHAAPQTTAIQERRERQDIEDANLRRIGTGLVASALVTKALSGIISKTPRPEQERGNNLAMEMLNDLLLHGGHRQNLETDPSLQVQPEGPVTDPDFRFQQTMNTLYTSLGLDVLAGVSPYRQAGWEDKYLEQKENSADITAAPSPPEIKTPSPEPLYRPEFQMNLGPSTM